MIDRLVDWLESNRRTSLPIMIVLLMLLAGVFIWRQVTMWLVLLAVPHIFSFGDTLLFYLYVGGTVLFVLMPFALSNKVNNRETSNSGKELTKKPKTTAIRWYLKGLSDKRIAENKCNDTEKDSCEATDSHTSSLTRRK